MNNEINKMFSGIEVISFNSEGTRDSKMESQLKKGLLNYGVKKGYIKQDKKGVKND